MSTSTILTKFLRIGNTRCPVCGRSGWCLLAKDGRSAICARKESAHRWGEAGWFHRLGLGTASRPDSRSITLDTASGPNAELVALAEASRIAVDPAALENLAEDLGISVASLQRLGTGWSDHYGAFSFPMCDATESVIGIRLRSVEGQKFAVRGSRQGLHIPQGLGSPHGIMFTEGPTDCAAILDLGLPAVGRPSCCGGTEHVVALIRRLQPALAIVAGDNDPPLPTGQRPGLRGAQDLAGVIALYHPCVKLVLPPPQIKDMRDWKRAGAIAADVKAAVTQAPLHQVNLSTAGQNGDTDV